MDDCKSGEGVKHRNDVTSTILVAPCVMSTGRKLAEAKKNKIARMREGGGYLAATAFLGRTAELGLDEIV